MLLDHVLTSINFISWFSVNTSRIKPSIRRKICEWVFEPWAFINVTRDNNRQTRLFLLLHNRCALIEGWYWWHCRWCPNKSWAHILPKNNDKWLEVWHSDSHTFPKPIFPERVVAPSPPWRFSLWASNWRANSSSSFSISSKLWWLDWCRANPVDWFWNYFGVWIIWWHTFVTTCGTCGGLLWHQLLASHDAHMSLRGQTLTRLWNPTYSSIL